VEALPNEFLKAETAVAFKHLARETNEIHVIWGTG